MRALCLKLWCYGIVIQTFFSGSSEFNVAGEIKFVYSDKESLEISRVYVKIRSYWTDKTVQWYEVHLDCCVTSTTVLL